MEGFSIGHKGSFLEKVIYDKNEISLLADGDGVEVLLQTIEKDRLFYIYPTENPEVMEYYFILSGKIVCEFNGEKVILGPHDSFTAKGITEPTHFTALSDVTFLWVITEKTFSVLKNEMSSLMEIVKQVEIKDQHTYMHSDRVANYALKIARKFKLNEEQLENLATASFLHDIGKIHIPKEILNKPDKLTTEEFEVIKKHPADGAEMIKGSAYEDVAIIIEQHHERLNGSGYPKGLKDDEILLEARIIAVSDTFDAMTEDRAYRKAFSAQYALDELKKLSNTHYDKEVVDKFELVLKEEGVV
ncbi:HD domain-containing protein [Paenisporosarcina quisquiliarum]|uniref:HD domain-containing protein n=1 Tax=Paenisporosarcina quisquiliarum TaxID=365346 RepID=A0A9X3LGW4_9BACL|nr:HD domain-containing phosphohydrolase [Paenisporosarcina quisquiliarum]MCZ8537788.1 HD domain-containing protein [Paenisporosarcina quisquiliarum]